MRYLTFENRAVSMLTLVDTMFASLGVDHLAYFCGLNRLFRQIQSVLTLDIIKVML